MNAIVHPKVASHFKRWVNKQDSPYVISEAAILFENGSYKKYDFIITVTAPENIRLQRVIKRDNSNKQKVEAIMANQWSDQEKIKRSFREIIISIGENPDRDGLLNTPARFAVLYEELFF